MNKALQIICTIVIAIVLFTLGLFLNVDSIVIYIGITVLNFILAILYIKGIVKFNIIKFIRVLVILFLLFFFINLIFGTEFFGIVEDNCINSKDEIIIVASRILLTTINLIIIFLSFKNVKNTILILFLTIIFSSLIWNIPCTLYAYHEHKDDFDKESSYTIKEDVDTFTSEEIYKNVVFQNVFFKTLHRYEEKLYE